MRNKITALLFAIPTIIISASCESQGKDGEWESMQWNGYETKNGEIRINVPTEGGTYTFTCKNYNIWLSDTKENEKYLYIQDFNHATGEWSDTRTDKNVLTVTLLSNDGKDRTLKVCPTAGDIFGLFIFSQQGKND